MEWLIEYMKRMFGWVAPVEEEEEVGPEPPRRMEPEELEEEVGPEPPRRT